MGGLLLPMRGLWALSGSPRSRVVPECWARSSAGPSLAERDRVDRAVIATASELFECRHYPGVVAICTDALESEPECVPLLLIRARAHIALRRDLDAQADLRDIIGLDSLCSLAFRLLGELAARRDENESAAIFFREALRLDPGDREAADWLLVVTSVRPAAVATTFPAPATAAGRFPRARTPDDVRLPLRELSIRRLTQPELAAQYPRVRRAIVSRSVRHADRVSARWIPRTANSVASRRLLCSTS